MNWLGIAIYLLMTAWLLLASASLIAFDVLSDIAVSWRPMVGLGLGLLAVIGIGWGHVEDWEDEDDRRREARRRQRG